MNNKRYSLRELSEFLAAKLRGDPNCIITSIGALDSAKAGDLSFLNDARYTKYLDHTQATAVIIKPEALSKSCSGNFLIVADPYLAYAKISALFDDTPEVATGIHPTVILAAGCEIADKVAIGPYCVVGNRVKIGRGVRIEAGCVVMDEVIIGDDTRLLPNVTLYHRVCLGKRGLLHSGVVVGSDGFGNANEKGVWHKIHQLGSVVIGDDVEIGANTTIDRGAIGDTIIADGVKLDNQVQIGHNVQIGSHTAIAGCVGIAGSTKIGRYCMIGGQVGINGHIEIADRVIITGGSNVGKSITKSGGIYASAIPAMLHRAWWRILSRLTQIEDLIRRLKLLEKR